MQLAPEKIVNFAWVGLNFYTGMIEICREKKLSATIGPCKLTNLAGGVCPVFCFHNG